MNNQSDERAVERQKRKAILKVLGLSFLSGFGTPIVRHPDERIAATTQRWAAFSGAFLSIALGIDMFVRIVILKKDFPTELCLIWMANLFIVGIGQIRSGVPAVGATGGFSWKTSGLLVAEIALLVPAMQWWMGGIHSWSAYFAGAALSGACAFVMLLILRSIYGAWVRRTLGPESHEEGGE